MVEKNMKLKYFSFILMILLISCTKGSILMGNNKLNYYWIQKSDYSTEYFKIESKNKAIDSIKNINWINELKIYNENDKNNNCPPGIGFHNGLEDGKYFTTLLHICPIDDKKVFFNFHYSIEKKFLGIIKYDSSEIFYKEEFPFENVDKLIESYFNSDYKKILNF
jgi:hypothetical protein